MKIFLLFLISLPLLANDLSFSKTSEKGGESKFDRIDKLESYLSGLSSSLKSIHKNMEQDFKKQLKELDKKISDEFKIAIEKKVEEMDKKIKPLYQDGKVPEYASKKDAHNTQKQVEIMRDRVAELIKKVQELESEIKILKDGT